MSLKTKIPLLVAFMLLINIAVIMLFNRIYFMDKLAERIEAFSGWEVDADKLRASSVVWELVILEIVVIGLIIFAVGVAAYLLYARPLIKLNGMVGSYKSGVIENTARNDEIGQLQNSFHRLSQKLCEEKQTQNRIIASISHDIKTPLTSVLGHSERLLTKEYERERLVGYLNKIHASARDIAAVVDEFDDYLGTIIPETTKLQSYDVSYLCSMLSDEYQDKICDLGGVFLVENRCGGNDTIHVDLLGLRRVFANVIGNSIRHSGADRLEVKVMVCRSGEGIVFKLSDNGRGVSEAELPHLFEPFYTSDKSRKLSGLGLAICKQIVEAMGGSIQAEVESGFGVVLELKGQSNAMWQCQPFGRAKT